MSVSAIVPEKSRGNKKCSSTGLPWMMLLPLFVMATLRPTAAADG